MKYIDDYTDQELVNITDDQYDALIDLECARNGAPIMVGECPVKPEIKTFEKDFEFYKISAFKCDKETMQKVMEALQGAVFYKRDYGSEVIKKTEESYEVAQFTPSKGFSEQKYNEIRIEKESYDAMKSEYDVKLSDYQTAVNDRSDSIATVQDRVSVARENARKIESAKYEWEKYLELSNNDENIAMNFMKQRHSIGFIESVVPSYFEPKCA